MSRPTHGGNLVWAAQIANCPISQIIDFSASINPLGPPKTVVRAISQSLDSLKAYPDPNYTQLRAALAQWHQIPSDYILPGNGAAELLNWAAWELARWDSTYLITPAFADYRRSLSTFGVKIHRCRLRWEVGDGDWHLSLPSSPSQCGLIWNNPHNPTGKLWQAEEILPQLEQFSLVVVDEAFMDFLPPPQQPSLIAWVGQYPNLVILRSLTKFYSIPGLRLGYAVTHPDRVRRWQQWRDPWAVNCFATPVAIAAVNDHDFQQQTWAWLPSAREKLSQGLKSIAGVNPLPGAANFLLVETQSGSWLQQQLLQHQILIRDCLSFPEIGDRAFRIAVREDPDHQRLIGAIKQILG